MSTSEYQLPPSQVRYMDVGVNGFAGTVLVVSRPNFVRIGNITHATILHLVCPIPFGDNHFTGDQHPAVGIVQGGICMSFGCKRTDCALHPLRPQDPPPDRYKTPKKVGPGIDAVATGFDQDDDERLGTIFDGAECLIPQHRPHDSIYVSSMVQNL